MGVGTGNKKHEIWKMNERKLAVERIGKRSVRDEDYLYFGNLDFLRILSLEIRVFVFSFKSCLRLFQQNRAFSLRLFRGHIAGLIVRTSSAPLNRGGRVVQTSPYLFLIFEFEYWNLIRI